MALLKQIKNMRIFPAQGKSELERFKESLITLCVDKNVWVNKQMLGIDDRPNQRYLEGMKTMSCYILTWLKGDKL